MFGVDKLGLIGFGVDKLEKESDKCELKCLKTERREFTDFVGGTVCRSGGNDLQKGD